jgi:hypothetical protein
MDPEEIEILVAEYANLMGEYEEAISRAKTVKSDRKRLLFVTDAEIAFKSAQILKKELFSAGYVVKRSI